MKDAKLKTYARNLRKNSTQAETLLWQKLRGRRFSDFKFRRQYIIDKFIVDFICLEKRLIIEIDGGQHMQNKHYDKLRDNWFVDNKYSILRFWNHEILRELTIVLEKIYQTLQSKKDHL